MKIPVIICILCILCQAKWQICEEMNWCNGDVLITVAEPSNNCSVGCVCYRGFCMRYNCTDEQPTADTSITYYNNNDCYGNITSIAIFSKACFSVGETSWQLIKCVNGFMNIGTYNDSNCTHTVIDYTLAKGCHNTGVTSIYINC